MKYYYLNKKVEQARRFFYFGISVRIFVCAIKFFKFLNGKWGRYVEA